MKKIAIFGTGYVGLVTGVCLAEIGNYVICVDIDKEKINRLNEGSLPIYEPDLEKLLEKNKKKLEFTTNAILAVSSADIIFIAVGTPTGKGGGADLRYVEEVARVIGQNISKRKIIVIKSTVPVGSEIRVQEIIKEHYSGDFVIASNPEFLREGSAIEDFMRPDRIVIGSLNGIVKELVDLYKVLKAPIINTDIRSAQLIKYASNAFLATKISFINEIANLSEKMGANVENIALGMGLDKRIGSNFLSAGLGYGGSCFPKDVKELIYSARLNGSDLKILESVEKVNEAQKVIPIKKLRDRLRIDGSVVAILGLTFKPKTDDLREAPSLVIINQLLDMGAKVKAWDPLGISAAKKVYPEVNYFEDIYECLEGVDAAIIVTEWEEVRKLDLKKIKKLMKRAILIDGRNVFDKDNLVELGFDYTSIGR